MRMFVVDKIARIIKNRKRLEEAMGVEIKNRGREVYIDGDAVLEERASWVVLALDFGFPYSEAMRIFEDEEVVFEVLNIKDYTNKANLERIRGRVIGKGGRALKVLSDLSDCGLELKENKIGMVGTGENLKRASEAIVAIIKGAKHGAVYKELEGNMPRPIGDLGIKKRE